jgi:hypothetical protein
MLFYAARGKKERESEAKARVRIVHIASFSVQNGGGSYTRNS